LTEQTTSLVLLGAGRRSETGSRFSGRF